MTGPDAESAARSLTPDDAAQILEQASLASQAGVPLPPGLRAMAAETNSPRTRRALLRLADRLEDGEPLNEVLISLHGCLPASMLTLIEQGAKIGRLDLILPWAAEQNRRQRGLVWRFRGALAYPFFLIAVAFAVGSLLLIGITPMYKRLYEDFGTELPPLTQFVISVSDFAINTWPMFVAACVVSAVAAMVFAVYGKVRFYTLNWARWIPVAGPLFRLGALSEFCHLLAVFLEVQLPLPNAIRLAGLSSENMWLRIASNDMASDIERGFVDHHSAISSGVPAAIAQLLRDSTSPEVLAEALHGLGDLYAARAEVNSRFVAIAAEPFVMIGTSFGLGTIVVALYLPLIKLLNDLS
jgi:type II secretory pathway component PulF